MIAALGIPILECEGFEADDVMATMARIVEEAGGECVLVTGDKDCRQLISDHVAVYNIRKDSIFDAAALQDEWGIRPDQVVDFQTLVGDSVDNIPGVPLVGPKVAGEWLDKFDTLDNLLAHADELPKGKRKENLLACRDQIAISRRLVRLHSEVPMSLELERRQRRPFRSRRRRRTVRRVRLPHAHQPNAQPAPMPTSTPAFTHRYETIATAERLQWLVDEMAKQKQISLDTETTSIYPRWAEIVGYSFAWNEGEAYYVPVRAPEGEPQLDPESHARSAPADSGKPRHRQDRPEPEIRHDRAALRRRRSRRRQLRHHGRQLSARCRRAESQSRRTGQPLSESHTTKIEALIGSGKNQKRMDQVPLAEITHYAAEDADVALRLVPLLGRRA